MQRIIKDGTNHDIHRMSVIHFTCDKCGCEFESDQYTVQSTEKRIDGYSVITDRCPYCNNWTSMKIKTSELRK